MDAIIELLNTLNGLSPLGIVGLLGVVIFMLVKNQKDAQQKYETVTGNHLHDLPVIAENIEKMAATMQRIEVKLGEDFAHIKARLNGNHNK